MIPKKSKILTRVSRSFLFTRKQRVLQLFQTSQITNTDARNVHSFFFSFSLFGTFRPQIICFRSVGREMSISRAFPVTCEFGKRVPNNTLFSKPPAKQTSCNATAAETAENFVRAAFRARPRSGRKRTVGVK